MKVESKWEVARREAAAKDIASNTYEHKGALWWKSVKRPVPVDYIVSAGMPVPAGQKAAESFFNAEWIAAYKVSMREHEHSAEELYEMRAAFGEGAEVVNVVTGKRTKL